MKSLFITAFKKTAPFQGGDELNAVATSSFKGNRGLKSEEDVIKLPIINRLFVSLILIYSIINSL